MFLSAWGISSCTCMSELYLQQWGWPKNWFVQSGVRIYAVWPKLWCGKKKKIYLNIFFLIDFGDFSSLLNVRYFLSFSGIWICGNRFWWMLWRMCTERLCDQNQQYPTYLDSKLMKSCLLIFYHPCVIWLLCVSAPPHPCSLGGTNLVTTWQQVWTIHLCQEWWHFNNSHLTHNLPDVPREQLRTSKPHFAAH